MISKRLLVTLPLAALSLAVLAFPAEALAWGPLAHLNFSAQALANLGVVQPSLRAVLGDFANDFLYGSLAADIVVGKNMARYLYHCHNWKVGFNVFKQARPGAEQAFSLGFLSHLAADTVAHNYFVPYKTVASFHKSSTRHAYWELRYDQRMDRTLSKLARQVSTRTLRHGHDRFLDRTLVGASVLPFGVSKQLFRSLLATARIGRFDALSRSFLAPERNLLLEPDLVDETNTLAVDAITGLLADGERCFAARADATGARNIRLASDVRKLLKMKTAHRLLTARDAHEIALETRESFRKAIDGKLVLPRSIAKFAA
jgi:Zinc dependent phospholipase C